MNDIKPKYFLEVWRSSAWGLCWAMRKFGTIRAFNRWYDYHEHFFGISATVHAGTNDPDITREELLKVATNHVTNNCITMQFDLKSCTVTKIVGRPSTPDYE